MDTPLSIPVPLSPDEILEKMRIEYPVLFSYEAQIQGIILEYLLQAYYEGKLSEVVNIVELNTETLRQREIERILSTISIHPETLRGKSLEELTSFSPLEVSSSGSNGSNRLLSSLPTEITSNIFSRLGKQEIGSLFVTGKGTLRSVRKVHNDVNYWKSKCELALGLNLGDLMGIDWRELSVQIDMALNSTDSIRLIYFCFTRSGLLVDNIR